MMGEIAGRLAAISSIVTDDNPRTEDAADHPRRDPRRGARAHRRSATGAKRSSTRSNRCCRAMRF